MSEPQKLSERLRDFLLDYGEASDEETEKMVTDAEALEAKCEHLETVFSELGIAFDDLKRMKEAEVATLRKKADGYDKYTFMHPNSLEYSIKEIEKQLEDQIKRQEAESQVAKAQRLLEKWRDGRVNKLSIDHSLAFRELNMAIYNTIILCANELEAALGVSSGGAKGGVK